MLPRTRYSSLAIWTCFAPVSQAETVPSEFSSVNDKLQTTATSPSQAYLSGRSSQPTVEGRGTQIHSPCRCRSHPEHRGWMHTRPCLEHTHNDVKPQLCKNMGAHTLWEGQDRDSLTFSAGGPCPACRTVTLKPRWYLVAGAPVGTRVRHTGVFRWR